MGTLSLSRRGSGKGDGGQDGRAQAQLGVAPPGSLPHLTQQGQPSCLPVCPDTHACVEFSLCWFSSTCLAALAAFPEGPNGQRVHSGHTCTESEVSMRQEGRWAELVGYFCPRCGCQLTSCLPC